MTFYYLAGRSSDGSEYPLTHKRLALFDALKEWGLILWKEARLIEATGGRPEVRLVQMRLNEETKC